MDRLTLFLISLVITGGAYAVGYQPKPNTDIDIDNDQKQIQVGINANKNINNAYGGLSKSDANAKATSTNFNNSKASVGDTLSKSYSNAKIGDTTSKSYSGAKIGDTTSNSAANIGDITATVGDTLSTSNATGGEAVVHNDVSLADAINAKLDSSNNNRVENTLNFENNERTTFTAVATSQDCVRDVCVSRGTLSVGVQHDEHVGGAAYLQYSTPFDLMGVGSKSRKALGHQLTIMEDEVNDLEFENMRVKEAHAMAVERHDKEMETVRITHVKMCVALHAAGAMHDGYAEVCDHSSFTDGEHTPIPADPTHRRIGTDHK